MANLSRWLQIGAAEEREEYLTLEQRWEIHLLSYVSKYEQNYFSRL